MAKYVYNDEDNKSDVCPAGVYIGTVTWSKDDTSQKNDDQIRVGFELDEFKGSLVFDRLTFSQAASPFIDIFLKATGHQPEKKGTEVELDASLVMGWRAWLNIGVEDDPKVEGKKINTIINYVLDKGVPPNLPF